MVQSVPEVLGCEKIRTRGSADYVFLDLHLWLDRNTPLQAAHATSHIVKDKLMARFPQLVDVVIHIEPPKEAAKGQGRRPKARPAVALAKAGRHCACWNSATWSLKLRHESIGGLIRGILRTSGHSSGRDRTGARRNP